MGRFILKIVIFLLPISLLFAFPAAVLLLGREEYPMETVVRMQMADPDIVLGKAYGFTYSTDYFYKTVLVREKKPEIISIGSSRTMQFRKEFFSGPFVNAAFGSANISQIEEFIKQLSPEDGPKVMILGVDHLAFRDDYSHAVFSDKVSTIRQMFSDFFSFTWRSIYFDYVVRGRFSLRGVLSRSMDSRHIGLRALLLGDGYRADGSLRYGGQLASPNRNEEIVTSIGNDVASLKNGRASTPYYRQDAVSSEVLYELDRVLALAKERGITVIGFLPPYAPSYYSEMISTDDEYRDTVFALPQAVRTAFSKNGFNVYNFSDASVLGETGKEYLNIDHPTDKLALRMLLHMAKRDTLLRRYVDVKKGEALLKNSAEDFLPLEIR